jgi:multiple sugar transport system substrate-binding protein
MIKKLLGYCAIAIAISILVIACNSDTQLNTTQVDKSRSPTEDKVLQIWWDKGYYPEEDEALRNVVKNWEQKTGNRAKISFYTNDELFLKTERAIKAGNPPDVLMNDAADRFFNPKLAWDGRLADVSDVINPIKDAYSKTVLDTVYYYNNQEKRRSYYAVPIYIGIPHIFYWRDLLQQAGKSDSANAQLSDRDIPQDWDSFWQFWQQVPKKLPTQEKQKIYGIGLPMSVEAADTDDIFEQILEAYNVEILNSKGELQVNNPQVRQGIINCIDWYTKFYLQGNVPPDALNWYNPDNNRSFINRFVAMTPNQSLSIPAAVKQDKDVYYQKMVTTGYPHKPNGKPMRYIAMIRQAIILADSNKQELAKDFLSYFNQPEVLSTYIKATGGRYLPVNKKVLADPFWTDPADPHISTAVKPFLEGKMRLPYTVLNPAYSLVLKNSVWGNAIAKVVSDKISPEQAGDEAISKIKQIFTEWERS